MRRQVVLTIGAAEGIVSPGWIMPYRLDLGNEPIVIIEVRGELSDAELVSMTRECTAAMRGHREKGVRTAVILDFTYAPHITPRQRRLVGEWRAEVRDLTGEIAVGMAMIVTSQVVRGILTAISWFQREPVPVVFVKSFREGLTWALARCDATGVDVPESKRQNLYRSSERPRRWATGNR